MLITVSIFRPVVGISNYLHTHLYELSLCKCAHITHLFPKSISHSKFSKTESKHKYSVELYSRIDRLGGETLYRLHNIYIFRTKANIIKSIKIDKKIQTQYILVRISDTVFFLLSPLYFKSYKYFASSMYCCTFDFLLYS